MSRGEAWLQHVANVLVGGTGLVYGWMRYFASPFDEFARVNHPWQPDLQGLHVVTAPLLVFASGLIWRDHVWKRVRSGFRPRRRLGDPVLPHAPGLGPRPQGPSGRSR